MPEVVLRFAADVATTVLAVSALLLAVRRFSSALRGPLTSTTALAWAGVAVLLVAAACLFGGRTKARHGAIVAALLVAAAALSVPHSGPPALVALWLPTVALVAATGASTSRRAAGIRRASGERSAMEPAVAWDARTTTLLRRYVDIEGLDSLDATVAAEVPAGGRIGTVHVAFQPPFAMTPMVEAAVVPAAGDSRTAEVRTTAPLPYGVRLEVRLPAAASAARTFRVRLKARERRPADRSSAASRTSEPGS